MFFDDGYFYGAPEEVAKFWEIIKDKGPQIGYYHNDKSTVLDLNPDKLKCENLGLSFSSEGLEVLGSPVGSKEFDKNFASKKFGKVDNIIEQLSEIDKSHPQQAFTVLNRSIKFKATFYFEPSLKLRYLHLNMIML